MIARRHLVNAALLLALAAPASAQTGGAPRFAPIGSDDVPIGRADAPVQLIEYASFACPHCAQWNAEVWPAFKRRYVDTGLVRFAQRELVTNPAAMAAAGALVARCAPAGRYYDAAAQLYAAQAEIAAAEQPLTVYRRIGARVGLSTTAVNACLRDPAALQRLNARGERAAAAGVDGTPVFVLNGRRLDGGYELAELSAAIDPLLTPAQRGRLPR